jgi:hypothetical protein
MMRRGPALGGFPFGAFLTILGLTMLVISSLIYAGVHHIAVIGVPASFPASQNVVLFGTGYNDKTYRLRSSRDGVLESSLVSPRSSFGNVLVDQLWPIFQASAVYGLNQFKVSSTTFKGGTTSASDSAFVINAPSNGDIAVLQSRQRIPYRPGQGTRLMITALFSGPFENVTQIAGMGTPEDAIGFGYVGTTFGILYAERGVREQWTLTVTAGSSTTENVQITLDSVLFNVPVTNSGNIQRTVFEIYSFTYTGWKTDPVGSTVKFLKDEAGPTTETFSFSATTANAAFARNVLGVTRTLNFFPQSTWNLDKLDGTGTTGVVLNPLLFNVYVIAMQYLGAGSIQFYVETTRSITPIPSFTPVHVIIIPNTRTSTSFGIPHFPASLAITNTNADGANATLKSGSMAGFVEGAVRFRGNRFSFSRTRETTVTAASYWAMITLHNGRTIGGKSNQGVLTVVSVSAAIQHTQPATVFLFQNPAGAKVDLQGNPNFQSVSSISGIYKDESATTLTTTAETQLIWTGQLAETGSISRYFMDSPLEDINLQPGESLSLCAQTNKNTAAYITVSITVREDN